MIIPACLVEVHCIFAINLEMTEVNFREIDVLLVGFNLERTLHFTFKSRMELLFLDFRGWKADCVLMFLSYKGYTHMFHVSNSVSIRKRLHGHDIRH